MQRVKEIGIRKVLGASVGSIVLMRSKDFLKLVLIAAVIAVPVAWLMMHQWLEDFAYRIHISGWVFLWSALSAAIIALATIWFAGSKSSSGQPGKKFEDRIETRCVYLH